ncbi:MAG: hypothetical protein ACI4QD_05840 [Kiritimatiellia bacterium]
MNQSVEVPNVASPWHFRVAAVDFGIPVYALVTSRDVDGVEDVVGLEPLYSANVKAGGTARGQGRTNAVRPTQETIANLRRAWQSVFLSGLEHHLAFEEGGRLLVRVEPMGGTGARMSVSEQARRM